MEALTPSGNLFWALFLRGITCGLVGGLVVVILGFLAAGQKGSIIRVHPRGLLYFAAGTEIGIALVVTLVFFSLYFWRLHVVSSPPKAVQ